MRRIGWLMIAFMMLFGGLAYADLLLQDNFDSYTSELPPGGGWSVYTNGGITVLTNNAVSFSPSNSVAMTHINDNGAGYLEHTHTVLDGQVTYEAYLRTNNTSNETITMSARSGGWPPGPWIAMGYISGYLSHYDGANWHNILSVSANQWYHVRIVVDVPSQTYDIYVDDMATPRVEGADFWDNGITSLDRIRFEVYQPEGGMDPQARDAAWIDSVLISTPDLARVPALSEVGLGTLALLMAVLAFWFIRQRKSAARGGQHS